ncbi:hypothetical protein KXD93_10490 [Mucilaginibacter sp. BJC16-A38]|uniref:hypothetical protein n=1 Tax=Mucilaginibacter phenanthrenivorans TaxID=1234842 RepID=UPI002157D401|nr:hypothetical protein [Mucilaginibacter phenanthrenivorans]MCR8558074.1 hypothetical protein [Mucilaginibacter phenanthrenivorans]
MKTTLKKTVEHKEDVKSGDSHEHLKTDFPLSEKDEVKQAEEKMRRSRKKIL